MMTTGARVTLIMRVLAQIKLATTETRTVMVRVTSVSPVTMVKTERITRGTMTGATSMIALLAVPWISKIHLFPSHEAGSMTRDCSKCSAALASLFLTSVQITNSAFTSGFVCV
jgi:hypothetical protein